MKEYAALVLRTSDEDGRGYGGFQWPESGPVAAPDWKPVKECGRGLHGLLWGHGDLSLLEWGSDALWQVVGLSDDELAKTLEFDGKCKFPSGEVVFSGPMRGAVFYLAEHGGSGHGFHAVADSTAAEAKTGDVIFAYDSSSVAAYDSSSVMAYGSSSVTVFKIKVLDIRDCAVAIDRRTYGKVRALLAGDSL